MLCTNTVNEEEEYGEERKDVEDYALVMDYTKGDTKIGSGGAL